MSHESLSGLEVRLPAKYQPPDSIASAVWILSRLGGWVVVVVKSNNSANSARLSYASQLELSLAKVCVNNGLLCMQMPRCVVHIRSSD